VKKTEKRAFWKRPSSHDTYIPAREQEWRKRYCLPRGCLHLTRTTWLCIEFYLSKQAGSTHLEEIRYDVAGPQFRAFAEAIGRPGLHREEAAVRIDEAYRARIRKMAPKILRIATRLG